MHPTVQAIYARVRSVHPKTLHAYMLAQLPTAPQDAHPVLAAFFSALTPPPLLHCARCHEDYTDVENNGRACYVEHDDEDPEYERVYNPRSKWQARWRCCDRTAGGYDGDQLEGGCFVGMHTTDRGDACFRADADSDDDKLVSCRDLGCRNISASPVEDSAGDDDDDDDDDDTGTEGTEDTDIVEIVPSVSSLGNNGSGKGNSEDKTRVAEPRASAQPAESNAESSKMGRMGAPAPATALKRRSDTGSESAGAASMPTKIETAAAAAAAAAALPPPDSPRSRGRGGGETPGEKTITDVEGGMRKRRKIALSPA